MKDGWIGVDWDGTLVTWTRNVPWNEFGEPIPLMIDRVRKWLAEGVEVRIFTARVAMQDGRGQCFTTGEFFTQEDMVCAIHQRCIKYFGKPLPVTCEKDCAMIELWDDRAIQVVTNTGRTLAEEHAAELAALRGAP